MEQFPSKTALMLARKRYSRGQGAGTIETMNDGIEAAVRTAVNYDGADIVMAILEPEVGPISHKRCQELWDRINGKNKSKTS